MEFDLTCKPVSLMTWADSWMPVYHIDSSDSHKRATSPPGSVQVIQVLFQSASEHPAHHRSQIHLGRLWKFPVGILMIIAESSWDSCETEKSLKITIFTSMGNFWRCTAMEEDIAGPFIKTVMWGPLSKDRWWQSPPWTNEIFAFMAFSHHCWPEN